MLRQPLLAETGETQQSPAELGMGAAPARAQAAVPADAAPRVLSGWRGGEPLLELTNEWQVHCCHILLTTQLWCSYFVLASPYTVTSFFFLLTFSGLYFKKKIIKYLCVFVISLSEKTK